MKSLIFSLLILISFACHANTITLTETNQVSLRDEVNSESISEVLLNLEMVKESTTYLFIDSPGGSVLDGLVLVHYLKSTKKDIRCIARYAASMAHAILESCPRRIGTDDNLLMQHKMSTTIQGSPSEIEGELSVMRGLEKILDTMEATRIGISVEEFERRTTGPWYTFGEESLRQNVIDEIDIVDCSPVLYTKSKERYIHTAFGSATLEYNGCPLVPISVKKSDH